MLNAKRKILVVGYLPPPPEGTAKITEVIVNSEYLKSNFQIEFLPLQKRKVATERGKLAGLNILYNLVNVLNYILKLSKLNPAIIYLPLAQNKLGFLRDSIFILIGKILGKKLCVHFHGGNFDLFYNQQGKLFRLYISIVLKKIDKLIVLAEKFKKQFIPFLNTRKISILYNCVPKNEFITQNRERVFSQNKILKILFIGYISKAKGALDLVQAIPEVIKKSSEPLEFILCGQPVDIERNITFIPDPHFGYTKIKKLTADKNLYQYVKIYTTLTSEEKYRLLSDADIFVFPTHSEGCGLVVLEAMAYGLPVITTTVGALEEMLKDGINCFLVQPSDYKSLAKKILVLINNSELRKQMGENNRKLVKEKYNPDVFLQNLTNIWSDVLEA